MDLNILLVDDEPFQLRLTKKLISDIKPDSTVSTAASAKEALAILNRESINLLITDIKMPEISGIELIRSIREESANKSIIIVILSGYGEFSYAKTAIQYGTFSYLLKPLSRKEMVNLLDSASKRIGEIQVTAPPAVERALEIPLAKNSELEYLLFKLLHQGELSSEDTEHLQSLTPRSDSFYVLMGTVSTHDRNRLLKSLEDSFGYASMLDYRENRTIFFFDGHLKPEVQSILRSLLDTQDLPFGLSSPHPIGEFDEALMEASSALEAAFFNPSSQLLQYIPTDFTREDTSNITEKIISAIIADESYHHLFDSLVSQHHNALSSRHRFEENLSFILQQLLLYYNIFFLDASVKANCYHHHKVLIHEGVTVDDMKLALDTFVQALGKIIDSGQHSTLHENCRLYIAENLSEGITLSKMAEDFSYNVTYFSELFTKVFEMNFTEYLLRVRMLKAAKLLTESDYKIYEVAKQTGFKDVAYFTKTFREYHHLSPGKYRQQFLQGQGASELLSIDPTDS